MEIESLAPRSNRAADVATKLAESIRAGALAPGDRLPSESEIARRLGVSRPVVREALAFLRADGLVQSRQGLGLFVDKQETLRLRLSEMEASEHAILDFLEFRLGMEAEAARIAALRRTADDVARMHGALAALQAADEADADSAEHDLAFHRAVADAAHSHLYGRVLNFVSGPLLNSIRSMRSKDGGARVHVEIRRRDHDRILAGIEEGDPERASTAMRAHIEESYRRYAGQVEGGDARSRPHPALGPSAERL